MYITEENLVKYDKVLKTGDRIKELEDGIEVISLAGLGGYALGTVLNSDEYTNGFTLAVKFAKLPNGDVIQQHQDSTYISCLKINSLPQDMEKFNDGAYVLVSPLLPDKTYEGEYTGLVSVGIPDLLNVVDEENNIYELIGTVKTIEDNTYTLVVLLEKSTRTLGVANLIVMTDDVSDIEIGDRLSVEIELINDNSNMGKELKRCWNTYMEEDIHTAK